MVKAESSSGIRAAVFACACLCFSTLQAADTIEIATSADAQQLLADAESLLASRQSESAFALLEPHETELAGNSLYDYLLGIAALDSGFHGEAIFSLRRAIATAPQFSGARMELARAYYESGNLTLARPLFANLLTENPPPGVYAVIDDYIKTIDIQLAGPPPRFRPYVEFAGGYDTNANASTDDQQFMGFSLSPQNLETESSFAEIGAGFNWHSRSSPRFGWYAGGRLGYRHNPDADFIDAGVINGVAGMSWQRGQFFGRAGAEAYWATRDGEPNSTYGGLDALFGWRLSTAWDLIAGLRGGALRYDDSIEVLDVNRLLYSAGVTYRFSPLGSVALEAVGGSDAEQQTGSPYGNSKSGGRIALTLPVGQSNLLYASVGSLTSDYDGLFFGTTRKDTQLTSMVQIEFRDVFTTGLSLIPRIRYIDNDSDVSLYDYDRTEATLLMRWTPQ